MAYEAATDVREVSALATAPPGLTGVEVRRRLGEFGPNAVSEEAPPHWRVFLTKFWSPIPWMLEAAIVFQLGIRQYVEAAVIAALLLFNATLGFIQESRASTVLAVLKKRLAPTALVRRDGEWVRLPASELVQGDAVRLPLGALVPADATIVSGSMLVDQSMLTGESVLVDANPGGQVYAGSLVRRGQAIAEVTATGSKTYFGRTAELVRMAHSGSTEQAAIFGVTRNLAIINGTVAFLIVVYAYVIALPSSDLIRLALTALLATIPVALPATFTLSAAFGAQILARATGGTYGMGTHPGLHHRDGGPGAATTERVSGC
jgi:H+-transporting ATPase